MNLHEFIFKKLNNKDNYLISFKDEEVVISHSVVLVGHKYSAEFVINKMDYFNDGIKWPKLNEDINSIIKMCNNAEYVCQELNHGL